MCNLATALRSYSLWWLSHEIGFVSALIAECAISAAVISALKFYKVRPENKHGEHERESIEPARLCQEHGPRGNRTLASGLKAPCSTFELSALKSLPALLCGAAF